VVAAAVSCCDAFWRANLLLLLHLRVLGGVCEDVAGVLTGHTGAGAACVVITHHRHVRSS